MSIRSQSAFSLSAKSSSLAGSASAETARTPVDFEKGARNASVRAVRVVPP
jgi:hypothetical protein